MAPLLTKWGPILIQKGHCKKNYSKHKREEPEEPESAACSIRVSVFCITLSKESPWNKFKKYDCLYNKFGKIIHVRTKYKKLNCWTKIAEIEIHCKSG